MADSLTARLAAVPADRLDRRHQPFVVSPPAGRLSVHLLPCRQVMKMAAPRYDRRDRTSCRSMLAKKREISRRAETPLAFSLAPGRRRPCRRRADQKDFTVPRAAAVHDFEFSNEHRNVVGEPLDGIALTLPVVSTYDAAACSDIGRKTLRSPISLPCCSTCVRRRCACSSKSMINSEWVLGAGACPVEMPVSLVSCGGGDDE